jgi:hypothetical protein
VRFGRHRGLAGRQGHQGLLHVWGSPSDHLPRFRGQLQVWRRGGLRRCGESVVGAPDVDARITIRCRTLKKSRLKPKHVESWFTLRKGACAESPDATFEHRSMSGYPRYRVIDAPVHTIIGNRYPPKPLQEPSGCSDRRVCSPSELCQNSANSVLR